MEIFHYFCSVHLRFMLSISCAWETSYTSKPRFKENQAISSYKNYKPYQIYKINIQILILRDTFGMYSVIRIISFPQTIEPRNCKILGCRSSCNKVLTLADSILQYAWKGNISSGTTDFTKLLRTMDTTQIDSVVKSYLHLCRIIIYVTLNNGFDHPCSTPLDPLRFTTCALRKGKFL